MMYKWVEAHFGGRRDGGQRSVSLQSDAREVVPMLQDIALHCFGKTVGHSAVYVSFGCSAGGLKLERGKRR